MLFSVKRFFLFLVRVVPEFVQLWRSDWQSLARLPGNQVCQRQDESITGCQPTSGKKPPITSVERPLYYEAGTATADSGHGEDPDHGKRHHTGDSLAHDLKGRDPSPREVGSKPQRIGYLGYDHPAYLWIRNRFSKVE